MHVTEHNKFMLFPHPKEDSYLLKRTCICHACSGPHPKSYINVAYLDTWPKCSFYRPFWLHIFSNIKFNHSIFDLYTWAINDIFSRWYFDQCTKSLLPLESQLELQVSLYCQCPFILSLLTVIFYPLKGNWTHQPDPQAPKELVPSQLIHHVSYPHPVVAQWHSGASPQLCFFCSVDTGEVKCIVIYECIIILLKNTQILSLPTGD